jgi:hypothetical protein
MPTRIACQAIFQGSSGVPKDEFINTFHFAVDAVADLPVQTAKAAAERIANFYIGGQVGVNLASLINRTVLIKCYDEDAVRGPGATRPILYEGEFNLPAANSAQDLPTEVALALSYYSVRNAAGSRGRIYIGPLNMFVYQDTTDGPRPAGAFLTDLAISATALADPNSPTIPNVVADLLPAGVATGVGGQTPFWCVRTTGVKKAGPVLYKVITGGWIDNEWDTQRRRRLAATARDTWVAASSEPASPLSGPF